MYSNLSIKDLIEKLKKQEITSVSLINYYIDKIKKLNNEYNVYLFVRDEKELIEEATKADLEYKKGSVNKKLLGIPYAIKDSFMAVGTPTTAGDKFLENTFSEYDSVVVEKLKSEGAILIGKTNMDSWGFGGSTENSAYGPTKNPHDKSRIPGGSSGGSAAALALDMCAFSIGEDTGGSVRNPASHCGLYGLKPTYGRISRFGCIAYASSLDTVGIFTKYPTDLDYIFSVISTEDYKDMTYVKYEINHQIKKIFAYSLDLIPEGINPDIKNIYLNFVDTLRNRGFTPIQVDLKIFDVLLPTYYITAMAEASTNLARYQGTRFGNVFNQLIKKNYDYSSMNIKNWEDLFYLSRTEGFTDEAKRRIVLGAYTLMEGYADAYYKKAQEIRLTLRNNLDEIFNQADFLLSPVTPNIAKKIGEKNDNPIESYMEDIYTIIANLAGIPAIAFPVSKIQNMPIGLQIMGPIGSDEKLMKIVENYL